jgi:hypothetical protein
MSLRLAPVTAGERDACRVDDHAVSRDRSKERSSTNRRIAARYGRPGGCDWEQIAAQCVRRGGQRLYHEVRFAGEGPHLREWEAGERLDRESPCVRGDGQAAVGSEDEHLVELVGAEREGAHLERLGRAGQQQPLVGHDAPARGQDDRRIMWWLLAPQVDAISKADGDRDAAGCLDLGRDVQAAPGHLGVQVEPMWEREQLEPSGIGVEGQRRVEPSGLARGAGVLQNPCMAARLHAVDGQAPAVGVQQRRERQADGRSTRGVLPA